MSELVATRVLVRPGTAVRTRRTGELCRVVGPILHAATGQEGVAVEGIGGLVFYSLEAFDRVFESTDVAPAVPERVADQTSKGPGW